MNGVAFLFMGQESEKGIEVDVREADRPKCLYTLRFDYSAYKKATMNEVIKEVYNYVASKLKSLSNKVYGLGNVDYSDYEIYVALTSYDIEELKEYNYVRTTARGIITVKLASPFGQYALIVAEKEGY